MPYYYESIVMIALILIMLGVILQCSWMIKQRDRRIKYLSEQNQLLHKRIADINFKRNR